VRIDIVKPGPGQESVWDYPRPPVIQPTDRQLEVVFGGRTIAATSRGMRVLETSHPPVYYFPVEHVVPGVLVPGDRASYCEFKGEARYFSVVVDGSRADDAAWNFAVPTPGYEQLLGYVAFYPDKMDECRVDGEVVRPQPGLFYGGWITSDIVGPFKGEQGTSGW
jgi:uncharacterized protein (DUF427 family)